jgi:hypothetical protein
MVTMMWIQTPTKAAPSTSETSDARSTAFRAVEGGGNTRSGTILLVEAYAVVWLLMMFLVWRTMRRQGQIDARLAQLETELAEHHGAASASAAESRGDSD